MQVENTEKTKRKKSGEKTKTGADEMKLFISSWANLVRRMGWVYHMSFVQLKIPEPIMELLMFLYLEKGCVEPSVLADEMHTPRQTVTSTLDNMEAQGLIERLPHPTDRRRKLIRLAKNGKKLADDSIKVIRKHEQEALTQLSVEEVRQMLSLVERYCGALETSFGVKIKTHYLEDGCGGCCR